MNPFVYSDTNKRYHTYDYYMRTLTGRKCARIPLDGGFTCPNIDGTKGRGGCAYCELPHRVPSLRALPLREQFDRGCEILDGKWKGAARIAYFRDYTNTYAPTRRIRELCEQALSFPDVAGICIGTRADALEDETVEYLRSLDRRTFLTVELGLQTVHEETAERMNRGHTFGEFLEGYGRLSGLRVGIHLINSLPGETREMMMESVRRVAELHPAMIKLHMLYVTPETALYKSFMNGEFSLMTMEEYVSLVCDELEIIPPDICIGRLSADAPLGVGTAPLWTRNKKTVMNEIDKLLVKRGTYQGFLYDMHKN